MCMHALRPAFAVQLGASWAGTLVEARNIHAIGTQAVSVCMMEPAIQPGTTPCRKFAKDCIACQGQGQR
jgi:hypothetical protein